MARARVTCRVGEGSEVLSRPFAGSKSQADARRRGFALLYTRAVLVRAA